MSNTEQRIRLHPDELDRLARRLPRPVVSAETTDLQAGYQLGVQYVLELLREGWVIGESN